MFPYQFGMLRISKAKGKKKPRFRVSFNVELFKDDLRTLSCPGCFKGRQSHINELDDTFQQDLFDCIARGQERRPVVEPVLWSVICVLDP